MIFDALQTEQFVHAFILVALDLRKYISRIKLFLFVRNSETCVCAAGNNADSDVPEKLGEEKIEVDRRLKS